MTASVSNLDLIKFTLFQKPLSQSCPSLNELAEEVSGFSTSLPTHLKGMTGEIVQLVSMPNLGYVNDTQSVRSQQAGAISSRRSNCMRLDNDFGHWDVLHVLFSFTFVDAAHPAFAEQHSRKHCTAQASLDNVELGVNLRTWTLLLNFFGALGQKLADGQEGADVKLNVPVSTDPLLEALLYGKKLSECEVKQVGEFGFSLNMFHV